MPLNLRAWFLILAVPLGAAAAGIVLQGTVVSRLQADLKRPRTLEQFCAEVGPDDEVCATHRGLGTLTSAGVVTAGVGVLLLAGISLSGVSARRNRQLLLTLFRPGLRLTAVVLTGLITAHAGLLASAVYFLATILASGSGGRLILPIVIGGLAGIVAVVRSAFSVVQKAEVGAVGRTVSRSEAPALWQKVDETAARLGSLRPDQIVVGLDPTFFVTEANVNSLSGPLTGRTLFCSLPLARILDVDEFVAIVGHELGHFRGEDTQFSEQFYPVYRGTITSIVALNSAGGGGLGRLSLLPALAVFGYFFEAFSLAASLHSRDRELLADAAGASAATTASMATALIKVHAFSDAWGETQRASVAEMQAGTTIKNASESYAALVAKRATPDVLTSIADRQTSHPTDSHPPLSTRLSSLGMELGVLQNEALAVTPSPSAISLVADHETLEEWLSDTYQKLLASSLGLPLKEAPASSPAAAGPRTGGIRQCFACGTRVLPKRDGTCPRCGTALR